MVEMLTPVCTEMHFFVGMLMFQFIKLSPAFYHSAICWCFYPTRRPTQARLWLAAGAGISCHLRCQVFFWGGPGSVVCLFLCFQATQFDYWVRKKTEARGWEEPDWTCPRSARTLWLKSSPSTLGRMDTHVHTHCWAGLSSLNRGFACLSRPPFVLCCGVSDYWPPPTSHPSLWELVLLPVVVGLCVIYVEFK